MKTLLVAVLLLLIPAGTCRDDLGRRYPDGHGGEVFLPLGDVSFADEVVVYETGNPGPREWATDPEDALGIPDCAGDWTHEGYVSLGDSGMITLRFTDNVIVDREGPDIFVFEVGYFVEPMQVAVSRDGVAWTVAGTVEGERFDLDLVGRVQPGDEFTYIRLTDLGHAPGGDTPGADIDAVGVFGP